MKIRYSVLVLLIFFLGLTLMVPMRAVSSYLNGIEDVAVESSNGKWWSGNLNNLQEGKGYWVNITNSSIDFKWGMENCASSPEPSLSKSEPFANIPEEYRFTQSTEQAFYFFENIEDALHGATEGKLPIKKVTGELMPIEMTVTVRFDPNTKQLEIVS